MSVWLGSIGCERLVREHRKRYDVLRQIICQELANLRAAKLIGADLNLTLEANGLIAQAYFACFSRQ